MLPPADDSRWLLLLLSARVAQLSGWFRQPVLGGSRCIHPRSQHCHQRSVRCVRNRACRVTTNIDPWKNRRATSGRVAASTPA